MGDQLNQISGLLYCSWRHIGSIAKITQQTNVFQSIPISIGKGMHLSYSQNSLQLQFLIGLSCPVHIQLFLCEAHFTLTLQWLSIAVNNNNQGYSRGMKIMTWMGWRLSFICCKDPSTLNKVQVRPALLERHKTGGRSVSLWIFKGQSQS